MEVVESVEKPVVQNRPGTFVSGDPRIHDIAKARKGQKKELPPEEYVGAPEGCTEAYRVMWHVAKNPAGYDKTHEEKMLRKYSVEQPGKFREQFVGMGREETELKEKRLGVVVSDIGTEKCLGLVEKLLGEM